MYVTDSISLNYVQTLFYLGIDPRQFQAAHPTFADPDFGRFIFDPARLRRRGGPYTYLVRAGESVPCTGASVIEQLPRWTIGECLAGPRDGRAP